MTTRNAESMGTYGSTWEAHGYCGGGSVGELIGSLAGHPAIICGNADGVFVEAKEAERYLSGADPVIFAANDVGMYLPRVDHWCSLHTDHLGAWKSVRWLHHHAQERTVYHGVEARPFVDYVWDGLTPMFALSGYFAMQLAWIMGASPIVLCGCPGSSVRLFFAAEPKPDFGYGGGTAGSDRGLREQVEREMQRLPDFKQAVRSMSGYTREFFGGLTDG